MRLARRGRKKAAIFDLIVADVRAPRDGRFIEKVGTYNPNTNPASIVLNDDRAFYWLMNGVQPTDTVKAILSYKGLLFKRHLQIGVNKGALSQADADSKFTEWKESKEVKIIGKVEGLAKKKSDAKQALLENESKVKDARAEAIALKNKPAEVVEEAAPVAQDETKHVDSETETPKVEETAPVVTEETKHVVAETETPKVEEAAPIVEEETKHVAAETETPKVEETAPVATAHVVEPTAEKEETSASETKE